MAQNITSCPTVRGVISYNNTSGSICQLVVQFNYFYYTSSVLSVNFGLGVNSQGSSGGGGETHNRNVHVYINGTEVTTPGGEDLFNKTTNFTYTGTLTSIRVIAAASGSVYIAYGPSRTGDANGSFDDTFNITPINSTTDFVFTDLTQTTAALGGKFFTLPPASSYTNRSLIIKNKNTVPGNDLGGGQFRGQVIYLNTSNGDLINDFPSSVGLCMNDPYACLTLFSNGTSWYIANYYPSSNQPILPQASLPNTYSTANANINAINFFNSTSGGRNVGTNLLYLPDANAIGLCIVVYSGGSTSGERLSSNPLMIMAANNKTIDSLAGSKPFICVDNSKRSCGAVFVSDGINWYVVGYYNSSGWDWDSAVTGGNVQLTASSALDIKLTSVNVNPSNCLYSLPIGPNLPYLMLIKTQPGVSGIRYCTFMISQTSIQFINETSVGIFYGGNQSNSCVWFVAHIEYSPPNPLVNYYPVLAYTPGS